VGKVTKVRGNARKSQSCGSDRRSAHTVIFRNMVIKDPQAPFKNKDQKEQKRENSPQYGFGSLCKKRCNNNCKRSLENMIKTPMGLQQNNLAKFEEKRQRYVKLG